MTSGESTGELTTSADPAWRRSSSVARARSSSAAARRTRTARARATSGTSVPAELWRQAFDGGTQYAGGSRPFQRFGVGDGRLPNIDQGHRLAPADEQRQRGAQLKPDRILDVTAII